MLPLLHKIFIQVCNLGDSLTIVHLLNVDSHILIAGCGVIALISRTNSLVRQGRLTLGCEG